MNSYELSRAWWDFAFENPEKITPNHSAIYFFAIEHCNRLGWKDKFGFPTQMAMEAIGIKKHGTYIQYFNELVEWGFIKLIEKSKNQYSANIISLISAIPKNGKALDKAMVKHTAKQSKSTRQSNSESNGSIYKPLTKNQEPITNKQINIEFDVFWNLYNKKVSKEKSVAKWNKLSYYDKVKIIQTLPAFIAKIKDKQYQPHPDTYLNNRRWEDEETPKIPYINDGINHHDKNRYQSYVEYVEFCTIKKLPIIITEEEYYAK
jgi:hypothetical protein